MLIILLYLFIWIVLTLISAVLQEKYGYLHTRSVLNATICWLGWPLVSIAILCHVLSYDSKQCRKEALINSFLMDF